MKHLEVHPATTPAAETAVACAAARGDAGGQLLQSSRTRLRRSRNTLFHQVIDHGVPERPRWHRVGGQSREAVLAPHTFLADPCGLRTLARPAGGDRADRPLPFFGQVVHGHG
jgi:hypothetical protein